MRSQAFVTGVGIALIPVDPLPAGLLAERGAVLDVPRIRARGPQWPSGLALVSRVADVVVGLVHLARPRQRVAGRSVLRSEPPDIHLPNVERRLARDDPPGHHLPDPTGAGEPMCAETGSD